jgi:phage terminase large subunit-like protein
LPVAVRIDALVWAVAALSYEARPGLRIRVL